VLATPNWTRLPLTIDMSRCVDPATLAEAASEAPTEELRMALTKRLHQFRAAVPAISGPIRVEPQDTATPIGFLAPDAMADVLQKEDTGWQLVNYQGVVGWVEDSAHLAPTPMQAEPMVGNGTIESYADRILDWQCSFGLPSHRLSR
jgi:hypothetical protein